MKSMIGNKNVTAGFKLKEEWWGDRFLLISLLVTLYNRLALFTVILLA